MDKYTVSKYLVKKDINNKYVFVYNSLYINSRIIERETYNILENLHDELEDKCIKEFGEDAFIEFKSLKFVSTLNQDERFQLKEELNNRRKKLSSGCYFQRMHLSTTNKCNMNCEYCFCNQFEYKTDDNAIRFPMKQMEFEVADKAIGEAITVIKDNGNKSLSIEFFGGEPLLNYKLIISVLEKYKNGEEYDIDISYGCTTNGVYVADELLEYLEKYKVRVAISIDYIDYNLNTFRGEGKSTVGWEVLDKNICKLVDHNIPIKFQSVLSEQTWDKYNYNLINYAKEKNVESVGLILSFDFDFYKKYTPEVIANKVLDIHDYCENNGIELSGYWHLSFLGLIYPDIWNERRDWKTCPTIGRLLSVEPNGDIYACKTTANRMGSIYNLKEVFVNENYQYYAMRAYSNSPQCEGCELEGVCSGNCTGAVENKYKDIKSIDTYYCETVKAIINGLLKRYLATLDCDELEKQYFIGELNVG